jgi:hypothetical protein
MALLYFLSAVYTGMVSVKRFASDIHFGLVDEEYPSDVLPWLYCKMLQRQRLLHVSSGLTTEVTGILY